MRARIHDTTGLAREYRERESAGGLRRRISQHGVSSSRCTACKELAPFHRSDCENREPNPCRTHADFQDDLAASRESLFRAADRDDELMSVLAREVRRIEDRLHQHIIGCTCCRPRYLGDHP